MKITVCTLVFGEVPFLRYSEAINRTYCTRHGYQFAVIRPPRQIERSPIWFKVKGVADLLVTSDFVLFLDADAYFIDQSRAVDRLIDEQMQDASFLIGTDRLNKHFAFSDENANCGAFLVRRTENAATILRDWWNVPLFVDKRWLWQWPPEQAAFNRVVRPRWGDEEIRVIPYFHLNGSDGTYIRHLMGFSNLDRLHILRNEARRIGAVT
jgi:hypothetical protein